MRFFSMYARIRWMYLVISIFSKWDLAVEPGNAWTIPICQFSPISLQKRTEFCHLMYSNIWFISGNRNCSVIIRNPCNIGVITKRSIIHRISPKTKDLFEWASGVIKTVYEMKIPGCCARNVSGHGNWCIRWSGVFAC